MRRYESYICDSGRWEGFEIRPGDIIVTTPPKCGTTWMQMCCLVLVHGPELPEPLSRLSPWLDQVLEPSEEVRARLDAQSHRRVIKSHTPLDGLPWDPAVTYVVVGRDPRDVALSSAEHLRNMRFEAVAAARARQGLTEGPARAERPTDPAGAFRYWVDDDPPLERLGSSLKFTVHHLSLAWERRDEPNIGLFHYGDMRGDLAGEMRRLAALLGVDVRDDEWPALVEAATFESMRDRADTLAPNAHNELWHDNQQFFAAGRVGGWRDAVDADGLARYEARLAALVEDPDLLAWLHR